MNIENLMREFEKRQLVKSRTAFPFLSLLAVSACGGGGSGGSSPAPADPITGAVIKGPLQNAFVFLDFNEDGEHQVGIEPSTSTDADGSYSFTNVAASDATATVVAKTDSTTIDKSSGEILDNVVLKAPSGSSVVTPATTIMKEAGITKEEVSKVLGLPDGVDPTSFNPYGAGVDAATALAVEKVAQQVMTTITAVSSAVEGAGASSSDAFAVALGTVVDIVKDKAAVVQANPAAAVEVLDLSKPEEIAQVTAKVSEKIETTAGVTKADFDAVKADLDVAVQNVNTKITAVTDLTSAESMAAFAVATELKTQVKAATEAKGDPAVSITFKDTAAIETATTSKATDIQEAIDAGDDVTAPEPEPAPAPEPEPEPEPTPEPEPAPEPEPEPYSSNLSISNIIATAGTNIIILETSGTLFGSPAAEDFSVYVNGLQKSVTSAVISGNSIKLGISGSAFSNDKVIKVDYVQNASSENRLYDNTGAVFNSFSKSEIFGNDVIAPKVSISSEQTELVGQETTKITFKFSEEIKGFAKILKKTNTLVFLFCELRCNSEIITSASGVWKILKVNPSNLGPGG